MTFILDNFKCSIQDSYQKKNFPVNYLNPPNLALSHPHTLPPSTLPPSTLFLSLTPFTLPPSTHTPSHPHPPVSRRHIKPLCVRVGFCSWWVDHHPHTLTRRYGTQVVMGTRDHAQFLVLLEHARTRQHRSGPEDRTQEVQELETELNDDRKCK